MKLNVLCCAALGAAPRASAPAQRLGADDIVRQPTPLTRSLGAPAARGVVISPGEQDRVLAETASKPAVTIRVPGRGGESRPDDTQPNDTQPNDTWPMTPS